MLTGFLSLCLWYRNHPYQKALLAWQDDFNNEVLRSKGIFLKTRSNAIMVYNGTSTRREAVSWLAFALTEKEIETLKYEPMRTGSMTDGCCSVEKDAAVMIN